MSVLLRLTVFFFFLAASEVPFSKIIPIAQIAHVTYSDMMRGKITTHALLDH